MSNEWREIAEINRDLEAVNRDLAEVNRELSRLLRIMGWLSAAAAVFGMISLAAWIALVLR